METNLFDICVLKYSILIEVILSLCYYLHNYYSPITLDHNKLSRTLETYQHV